MGFVLFFKYAFDVIVFIPIVQPCDIPCYPNPRIQIEDLEAKRVKRARGEYKGDCPY